jgi:hypothetical protein
MVFHNGDICCQEELFVNNPFDVKENYEYAFDFALHLSRLFRLGVFGLSS